MDPKNLLLAPYTFRPATREDLPMLRQWLQTHEVARWWGDPDEQEALLTSDLDDPRMFMWIVEFEDKPFAYLQDYDVHAWPQQHLACLPAGSRGIDLFIGEPHMLGVGHGSALLRRFAERLCADGVPVVTIDPGADNLRARRAYARAGFTGDIEVNTEWGPVVLMTFREC